MIAEIFNLLAAVLTTLGAVAAAPLLIGPNSPAKVIAAAVLAIVGSLCWVVAAVAALVERRRRR